MPYPPSLREIDSTPASPLWMPSLKMIIDVSHLNDAGFDDVFVFTPKSEVVEQADALGGILDELGMKLTRVLNIHVPAEDLIERAIGRRICKKCGATYHVKFNPTKSDGVCDNCGGELYQRKDDNEETMKNRLSVYEASTKPLIDYYAKAGIYTEIDGRRPIEKVTEELVSVLSSVR